MPSHAILLNVYNICLWWCLGRTEEIGEEDANLLHLYGLTFAKLETTYILNSYAAGAVSACLDTVE